MRMSTKKMTALVAAGLLIVGGATLGAAKAFGGGSATPTTPAITETQPAGQTEAAEPDAGQPDTDNVQQGDQSGPDNEATDANEAAEPDAGQPDTDNVQQGDQTGADVTQK
jgi:hypothetical protein